jgi:hypothetical protein
MKDEEVYAKIESIYATEKGKGFITHLLRSFFPIDKASIMFFKQDPKTEVKCAITGESLQSKEEVFNHFQENKDKLFDNFIAGLKSKEVPHQIDKLDYRFAITCKDSTRYLSQQSYNQMFNFFATEMLKGNKHMNWLANQERKVAIVKQSKEFCTPEESKVVAKAVFHRANMSLGDLDILQQLKTKLELSEKQ